jgi:hypothetical protein
VGSVGLGGIELTNLGRVGKVVAKQVRCMRNGVEGNAVGDHEIVSQQQRRQRKMWREFNSSRKAHCSSSDIVTRRIRLSGKYEVWMMPDP